MKYRVVKENGWFEIGMIIDLRTGDRIAQMGDAIVPVEPDGEPVEPGDEDDARDTRKTVAGTGAGNGSPPATASGGRPHPAGSSKPSGKGKPVISGERKKPDAKKRSG